MPSLYEFVDDVELKREIVSSIGRQTDNEIIFKFISESVYNAENFIRAGQKMPTAKSILNCMIKIVVNIVARDTEFSLSTFSASKARIN